MRPDGAARARSASHRAGRDGGRAAVRDGRGLDERGACVVRAAGSRLAGTDLTALGFADGDVVDLVSVWSDGERRAPAFRVVKYPTPPGSAAAYFPEANVLVPLDSTADGSNTPTPKSVIIRLERAPAAGAGPARADAG